VRLKELFRARKCHSFQQPVLDLINKALRANKLKDQFIPLPLCDQTISLVLVPPSMYKKAVGAGLIPRRHLLDQ
jgi:hypothetical protein